MNNPLRHQTIVRCADLVFDPHLHEHGAAGGIQAQPDGQINHRTPFEAHDRRIHEIPVIGMPECLLNAEWRLKLDEVIVALPEEDPERLQEIRKMLKSLPVQVTVAHGWPSLRPLEN